MMMLNDYFVIIYYAYLKNKTWDVAILMSGRDLYIETEMMLNDYFVRGLANAGSACNVTESCILVEATKIHVSPIVLPHELGHALGMTHDDIIEGDDKVSLRI